MSADDGGIRLSSENARRLIDGWAEGLASVFETMADQKPEIQWELAARPDEDAFGTLLWWEQKMRAEHPAKVWVGAPRSTWEYAGALTLKAAGLETAGPDEARNTWLEILNQSLSAMAQTASSLAGREVTCGNGAERGPAPEISEFVKAAVIFKDSMLEPLIVGFSPQILETVCGYPAPENEPQHSNTAVTTRSSRTMDLLMQIELPVSISFGRMRMPMRDVLKLTTGSIVELDRGVNEPVEVMVNRCLIARGEVVVVEGNYGVRIQEIASRQERLRSVQ
jgi:flagellar motor switch protein FliN/FliY